MANKRLVAAQHAQRRLVAQLKKKVWHDRHLWLLLYGVYVCMSLLYGCAIWDSCLLSCSSDLRHDCTGEIGTSHCSILQAILWVGANVHNELVEWPLQL